jgi:8-oxo-dGTP pyrophosphatase MutT (NUDIX family)
MTESERIHVNVSVAIVTDQNKRVLLTYSDNWGMFTLPMARRLQGQRTKEPATRAAIRAAAEVLGVPVRLAEEHQGPKRVLARLESGRQLEDKIYTYFVYHVEPHPDFADGLQIRQPFLWLSPHLILSGAYDPISESARFILREVLADFEIPARIQHTSVLIVQRQHPERGLQFLMRLNPDWGYTLPAKRWQPPEPVSLGDRSALALATAQRLAREELGLEPGTDVTLSPARSPEFTTHGISQTQKIPAFGETDYVHCVFDATLLNADKLQSDRALAWVTPREIDYRWAASSHGEQRVPLGRSGRISRTAYEILAHEGLIPEDDEPDIDELGGVRG